MLSGSFSMKWLLDHHAKWVVFPALRARQENPGSLSSLLPTRPIMVPPTHIAPVPPAETTEIHIPAQQAQHLHQPQYYQQAVLGCGLRLIFWSSAVLSLVAWIFSMSATATDAWLDHNTGTFGSAGDRTIIRECYDIYEADNFYYNYVLDLDALCGHYISFTVFQFLAVISCSLAVVAVLVACFRPAAAACMSSVALGFAGGMLMGACAIHQVVAFSLALSIRRTLDTFFGQDNGISMGPTFYIAVTASIISFVVSGGLLGCSRHAGDGPIYGCCRHEVPRSLVGGFSADRVARVTVAPSTHEAPQIQVVAIVA